MVNLTRPAGHPPDASVTSDQSQISISSPEHPEEPGGHSQLATKQPQGDLSHTRPFRAPHSLTEGDLIIGKQGASAAITLVERTSRFTTILALPEGKDSTGVADTLIEHCRELPAMMRKTLT